MTARTRTVIPKGLGEVEVSLEEYGKGQPFLLLHGGGGPDTVNRFGAQFADSHPARVLAPVHPGFALTPRPHELDSMKKLAALYLSLIEDLGIDDVTVIGNSIGGWITVELGLLASPRVSGIVLIDAVGIEVPGHPVADFFTMSYEDFLQRAFHNPDQFRVDPSSLPEQAQAAMAANREALVIYTGRQMSDPDLAQRLGTLEIPTLVLWGEGDKVAEPEYGRAYAARIPKSRFQIISGAGHLPQLEQSAETGTAIWDGTGSGFGQRRK
jgi:pimeloyl-ACP methyl ester carboxylesterase